MISDVSGNLLEAKVQALVNPVNTKGVMGKGLALQFKQQFPSVFRIYNADAKQGEVRLGEMHVVPLKRLGDGPKWVINFPTKGHWRSSSRLGDIESGLSDLVETVRRHDIKSLALPPLGCGLGGLDWKDVRPMIENAFRLLPDVDVQLYTPDAPPKPPSRAK